jgi:hypothetical protein
MGFRYILRDNLNFFILVIYRTKMAKRCSKRRGAGMHRRTRRGGMGLNAGYQPLVGGRKKMMRTRRRNRRGGAAGAVIQGGDGEGLWG